MLKIKETIIWRSAPEVGFIALLIIFIGYLIDNNDPLLMHYQFNALMLCLAVVTLYYGIYMGIFMWGIFTVFLFITDSTNPLLKPFLLEKLFFVILFGLFFYNYKKSLRYLKLHNDYLKTRLKEFNSSFFTLKISHDKLESTYISQPTSLQYVLSDLLNRSDHNSIKDSAIDLLNVLEKIFMVKKSMIWEVTDGKLIKLIASNGEVNKTIDRKDKLLEDALLYKNSMYLKDLKDKEQTKYIVVVPYLNDQDEITSVLIIEEIPFLFYKEDVIIKINVIFNYMSMESEKRSLVEKDYIKENQNIENESQNIIDFKSEVIRLKKIKKMFDIDSRIYVLQTKNPYLHELITDYFYKNNNLKVLNQYISIQCEKNYFHFIIFPFTLNSTMSMLTKEFDEIIKILQDTLEKQLGKEAYQDVLTKSIAIEYIDKVWKGFNCVER